MAAEVANTAEDTVRRGLDGERPATLEALAEELAHEIRNPLNCALLQLAVLRRRLGAPDCPPATVLAVAELVERSLRRLEDLVDHSLAGFQARASDRPAGAAGAEPAKPEAKDPGDT